MKHDQQRVKSILVDTIRLICRNGLVREHELSIQGVIAITIDASQTFAIHMNDTFNGASDAVLQSDEADKYAVDTNETFNSASDAVMLADDEDDKESKSNCQRLRLMTETEMAGHSRSSQGKWTLVEILCFFHTRFLSNLILPCLGRAQQLQKPHSEINGMKEN